MTNLFQSVVRPLQKNEIDDSRAAFRHLVSFLDVTATPETLAFSVFELRSALEDYLYDGPRKDLKVLQPDDIVSLYLHFEEEADEFIRSKK